jgi:hypothetical protein
VAAGLGALSQPPCPTAGSRSTLTTLLSLMRMASHYQLGIVCCETDVPVYSREFLIYLIVCGAL